MTLKAFGIKNKINDYTEPYPGYLRKYESQLENLWSIKFCVLNIYGSVQNDLYLIMSN